MTLNQQDRLVHVLLVMVAAGSLTFAVGSYIEKKGLRRDLQFKTARAQSCEDKLRMTRETE